MKPDIRLNQKAIKRDLALIILLSSILPIIWIYYHNKIELLRLIILVSLSYFIGLIFITGLIRKQMYLKEALLFPFLDGKIIQVTTTSTKRTQSECLIEAYLENKKITFIPSPINGYVMVGSILPILFNKENPKKSVIVNRESYLEITGSTLKDN